MKRFLVGGPLLGDPERFAPLVSDPIVVDRNDNDTENTAERFVLLPNRQFVTVLAFKTGKRIGVMVPSSEEFVEITSVALVTPKSSASSVSSFLLSKGQNTVAAQQQQQLLVACADGSIRVFRLDELAGGSSGSTDTASSSMLDYCAGSSNSTITGSAACYSPARVIQVTKKGASTALVQQLVAVASAEEGEIIAYALTSQSNDNGILSLMRFHLPPMGQGKVEKVSYSSLQKQSRIHCVEEDVGKFTDEVPFSLKLVVPNTVQTEKNGDLYLLVASPTSILVYHHGRNKNTKTGRSTSDIHSLEPFVIDAPRNNPFSSIEIASNQKDLAIGHSSGAIRLYLDLFPRIDSYHRKLVKYNQDKGASSSKKPKSPIKGLTVQKLHWHAHPVATMAAATHGGDGTMMYSGGDESVVVTWQLARGSSKPAQVLPRISLGGITHMVVVADSALLVCCADNSIHLFATHNQFLRWKVQGVAAGSEAMTTNPKLMVDPLIDTARSDDENPHLILTGLPQAPGYIQKYDTAEQRVISNWEVVPFNRVSRTEQGDSPMPSPTVAFSCWSSCGRHAMTIDTAPTENQAIGHCEQLPDGKWVGCTTTIRFWSCPEGTPTLVYEPVSAMASPHGSENRVSAAALSACGNYGCTVSTDEKAFRLWSRVISSAFSGSGKSVSWVCSNKVSFPAGYSNYNASAVAFSSDASVVAIGFGSMVSLWDFHNVTLLTSLRHVDDLRDIVNTVQFVQSSDVSDMLMVVSSKSISMHSPFKNQALQGTEWIWEVPKTMVNLRISSSAMIPDSNYAAVSLYDERNSKSRLLMIDVTTGEISDEVDRTAEFDDEVVCLSGLTKKTRRGPGPKLTLYLLTRSGEVIALMTDSEEKPRQVLAPRRASAEGTANIPKLPRHLSTNTIPNKRPAAVLTMSDLERQPKKKLAIDRFGGFGGEESATSILPQLSGTFARSFIGRHLQREDQ